MKKTELVAKVAAEAGVEKNVAERVIDALGPVLITTLKAGGEATLPGIAKFTATDKPARIGRNPATGEALEIAAKTIPKVVALKALKDSLL